MSQRTVNLNLHWADIEDAGAADVLKIGGTTPGGESIQIRVRMDHRDSIGYLGAALHEALKLREAELVKVRAQLEGRG